MEGSSAKKSENKENLNSPALQGGLNSHFLQTFLAKDEHFIFILKKSERIAAALYLVTKQFEDTEPMKWTVRKVVGELVRTVHGMGSAYSKKMTDKEQAERHALELASCLEICRISGMMSSMNVQVIEREIHILLSQIRDYAPHTFSTGTRIAEKDFFAIPEPRTVSQGNTYGENQPSHVPADTEQGLRRDIIKDKNNEMIDQGRERVEGDSNADRTTQGQEKLKEYGPVAVKRNKRRALIINVIKKKKKIMIKDLTPLIRDCSEKTLQRELSNLVDEGVLEKEGERRWTTYSLA